MINKVWYSNFVTRETIINSFVITDIMPDFNGSEDNKFIFPTHISEYIDDDMDNKNNIIISKENNQIINIYNKNKFTIKHIREEVIKEKKDNLKYRLR